MQTFSRLPVLIALLLTCLSVVSFAQSRTVTGTVLDETGQGLPGVSVLLVGTRTGATTDAKGEFKIQVPGNDARLRISYIGYKTVEQAVGSQSTISVKLESDATALNEVTVLGFGEQVERRNLSGAVATVKAREIANVPAPNVEQLLQGRAAGVQIVNNSGAPGGGLTVRVRGTTSLSADNQPLYVVDGIPIRNENLGTPLAAGSTVSPIADINPNDIESIEVLKDASTAAIYGARAANGVVLIRTKRGKAGKPQIDVNAQAGVSISPTPLPLMNATQFKAYAAEWNFQNGSNDNAFRLNPNDPGKFQFGWYPDGVRTTDWQQLIRQNGPYQSLNASVRGGSANSVLYNVSGGYYNEKGIIIGSDFERINGRVNLDMFPADRLQISTSLNVANSNRNVTDRGTFFTDPIELSMRRAPDLQLYIVDPVTGEPSSQLYGQAAYDRRNPYAVATQYVNQEEQFRTFGNVTGTYFLIKDVLSVKANYGIDYTDASQRQFTPANGSNDRTRPVRQQRLGNLTWFQDLYANYVQRFGKSDVQGLIAFSQQKSTNTAVTVAGRGGASDQPGGQYIGGAAQITNWNGTRVPSGLSSLSAKGTYTFNELVSVSALIKREASSRFPAANRVGYFPAFSGYFRLSQLPFFQSLSDKVSDLKVRASWGVTGNQNGIGDFAYLTTYAAGANYMGQVGVNSALIPNDQLKWETTKTSNIGLDLGVLNGRFFVSADYYIKNTEDLLLAVNVPTTAGFASYIGNVGATRNSGFELAIQGDVLQTKNFRWNTNFNIATNKNVLVKSSSGDDLRAFSGDFLGIGRVGEPLGTWYGLQAVGVLPRDSDAQLVQIGQQPDGRPIYSTLYQNPGATPAVGADGKPLVLGSAYVPGRSFVGGDMLYNDTNGDGRISDADLVVIGRAQPKFYGGINNSVSFKNRLTLDFFFQYQYGNDVINGTRREFERADFADNQLVSLARSWRTQGDITDIPRLGERTPDPTRGSGINAYARTSRWIEDGSYIRLKNVTLSYNLPTALTSRLKLGTVRFYASGYNVLTFSKYKGMDPEFNNSGNPLLLGLDYMNYPQPRRIVGGVSITF